MLCNTLNIVSLPKSVLHYHKSNCALHIKYSVRPHLFNYLQRNQLTTGICSLKSTYFE